MEKMKEYWNKYRKEYILPEVVPPAEHCKSSGFFDWLRLTEEEKRIRNHFDGYRAYKEHIEHGLSVMPKNCDEFEKEMDCFYGWDFSVTGEKLIQFDQGGACMWIKRNWSKEAKKREEG